MTSKPEYCKTCPFAKHSTGFVRDYVPKDPKLAIVVRMPNKDEIVSGVPFSGRMGWKTFKDYFSPVGLKREDVLISQSIRCSPNTGVFPVGQERKLALESCRHWDEGIVKFNPTIWGTSFNPVMMIAMPSTGKFLKRAVERAVDYIEKGHRPCLLLGEEAREVYGPWLLGSMKKWQGFWWTK